MLGLERGDLLQVLPVSYRVEEFEPVRHRLRTSLLDGRKVRSGPFDFFVYGHVTNPICEGLWRKPDA
jgi:hypothetical protein